MLPPQPLPLVDALEEEAQLREGERGDSLVLRWMHRGNKSRWKEEGNEAGTVGHERIAGSSLTTGVQIICDDRREGTQMSPHLAKDKYIQHG